jgi:alpha-methylacyl-CoA racemase
VLPLEGVRVLDLSRLAPGGFCSMLLADFGADVVKIEDATAGDYIRWLGPKYQGAPRSAAGALFLAFNRGKRSARLDLKHPEGKAAFLRLVERADVVLEGFRPGVMERLGLGFERLSEVNERIVQCSISGYGQEGPAVERSGHDLNYLALAGALELSGELDGPPIAPPIQIADFAAGALMAVIGILLALAERERSGRGQLIDTSMYDGTLSLMLGHAAEFFATGIVRERGTGALTGGSACYQPYLVKDGWVTLAAIEPKFWANFCRGVGREDLIEHHDAATDTWAHGQLELIFLRRTRAEWKAFADEHDCCLEPVLRIDEAIDSELARARRMILTLAQPGTAGVRALGPAIKLSRTPAEPAQRPSPGLGEHTEEVLTEAGLSHAEVRALLEGGAAAGPADPPVG